MNDDDLRFDPAPDPRLQKALRDLDGEPPLEQVDWVALRRSISDRAEMPLARRRRAQRTAPRRWLQLLIPAAAAAGLALVAIFGVSRSGSDAAPLVSASEAARTGFITAEEALRADLSDDEFVLLVAGLDDSDALLRLAVEGP